MLIYDEFGFVFC